MLTFTSEDSSFTATCLFLLLLSLSANIAQGQGLEITVPRVINPPVIDGTVDDLEWSKARVVQVDIEVDPGDNIEAAVTAQALLMEDGEKIYVAFKAQDPDPDQIRGFYEDRDSGWDGDYMGIILDTFNYERRAF